MEVAGHAQPHHCQQRRLEMLGCVSKLSFAVTGRAKAPAEPLPSRQSAARQEPSLSRLEKLSAVPGRHREAFRK